MLPRVGVLCFGGLTSLAADLSKQVAVMSLTRACLIAPCCNDVGSKALPQLQLSEAGSVQEQETGCALLSDFGPLVSLGSKPSVGPHALAVGLSSRCATWALSSNELTICKPFFLCLSCDAAISSPKAIGHAPAVVREFLFITLKGRQQQCSLL